MGKAVAIIIIVLVVLLVMAAVSFYAKRRDARLREPSGEWKPRFQDGRVEVIRQGEKPILIDTIEGFGAGSQDRLQTAMVNAQDEADARNYVLKGLER